MATEQQLLYCAAPCAAAVAAAARSATHVYKQHSRPNRVAHHARGRRSRRSPCGWTSHQCLQGQKGAAWPGQALAVDSLACSSRAQQSSRGPPGHAVMQLRQTRSAAVVHVELEHMEEAMLAVVGGSSALPLPGASFTTRACSIGFRV